MKGKRFSMLGKIKRISGPVVIAEIKEDARMYDLVYMGALQLMGEIIRIDGNLAFTQVFEDTTGLSIDEEVRLSNKPLSVALGPGLLGNVYDGIQRPLEKIREQVGDFIPKGFTINALDEEKKWEFIPIKKSGEEVSSGDAIGYVMETQYLKHHILVPPGVAGVIKDINSGNFTVKDTVATLEDKTSLTMMQYWPVKIARPVKKFLEPNEPFITKQRVLDCLFPIAKGGNAIIPGGFGTGKTVLEQTLAKYSDVDIIVYIGCGERGNEMADVLTEFPELKDPKTGGPLMNRTILIANTSNMPVAAREASIYTGITLAEYYRDMGYKVALMADSTSRWAEALREISSRLEEMPGEEGYPTYLSTKLAKFYERSGKVICQGSEEKEGSLTVIGAVSPPGGDFSEPVTQASQRVTGGLWALDSNLAYRRHYPAINWNRSYTLYYEQLENWFVKNVDSKWPKLRAQFSEILQKDAQLQEVVQLVGPDALQASERLIIEAAKMARDHFLQQNSFSENDASCSLKKQHIMLRGLIRFFETGNQLIKRKVSIEDILALPLREMLAEFKETAEKDIDELSKRYESEIEKALEG